MCSYFNHREVQPNWRLIENQEFERMNKDCDVTNLGSLDFKNFLSMFKCLLENTDFKKLNIRGWQKDGVIPYTESLIWQSLERELRLEKLQHDGDDHDYVAPPLNEETLHARMQNQTSSQVIVNGNTRVNVPKATTNHRNTLAKAYNTVAQDETLSPRVEQILADQTASVNDLKTILYLVHAQHVALTDAVHGFIRDQASIARGSDVYNLPGGINGVAGRNRIVLGLTNAKQRQDENISAREAKQAKMENEIKDATEFLASIREKSTTRQVVSSLRSPTSTRSMSPFSARDRDKVRSNLSSSSKFRVGYLKIMK